MSGNWSDVDELSAQIEHLQNKETRLRMKAHEIERIIGTEEPEPVNLTQQYAVQGAEVPSSRECGAQAELTSEEKIQHSFEQVNRINRDLYSMSCQIAALEQRGVKS